MSSRPWPSRSTKVSADMPIQAATDLEVVREVLERRRKGEPRKAIAMDVGIGRALVDRWTAHMPYDGNGARERRRLAIMKALDEGLDVRSVASRVGCSLRQVIVIIQAIDMQARAFAPVPVPTPEQLEASRLAYNADQRRRYAARKAHRAAYDFEGPQLPDSPGNSDY